MSPLATIEAAASEIVYLELDELEASPLNPRKTLDPVKVAELAESIREHGILVPLLIRVVPTEGEIVQYHVIAGSRRQAAAAIAGKHDIPCIVREMTDDEARELAIVDNLQRADVEPLEEAEAFGEMLERLLTVSAVAAKLGKEQSYVAKRLKLLSLTIWSREALREKLITIDHAMLLARLAEMEQNEALKWCVDPQAGKKTPVYDVVKDRVKRKNPAAAKDAIALDSDGDSEAEEDDDLDFDEGTDEAGRRSVWNRAWECESVQRLKEHIECSSGEVLDRAPWLMEEDWLVPDAGSCLDCPKNTKANTPLFGDLDMGVAVCTDGACFKTKVDAFVLHGLGVASTAAAEKAKIPGKTAADFQILRVSWKETSTAPRQLKDGGGVNPAQVFKDGQWVEATKTCENARSAVAVDWSDANDRGYMGGGDKLRKPGEIVQVCVTPNCKAHPKAYEQHSRAGISKDNEARREAAQKKLQQDRSLENQLRMGWAVTAIGKVKTLSDVAVRKLLLGYLTQGQNEQIIGKHLVANPRSVLGNAAFTSVEFAQVVAAIFIAQNQLSVSEWYPPTHRREDYFAAVKALGVDARPGWEKPKEKKAAKVPAKKAAAKKVVKKAAKKAVKPAKKAVRK